jgi:hypothetical protein
MDYTQTAPIGQWLNRASGSVDAETLEQIVSAMELPLRKATTRNQCRREAG